MTEPADGGRDALARHMVRAAEAATPGLDVADVVAALAWALGEILAETTAVEPRPASEALGRVIWAGFEARRAGRGV